MLHYNEKKKIIQYLNNLIIFGSRCYYDVKIPDFEAREKNGSKESDQECCLLYLGTTHPFGLD